MTERDFHRDMRTTIDEATAQGPYVPRQLASEIVEKLEANDPDLLQGWLSAQAEHFVWQAISDRNRSVRAAARYHNPRSAFRDAVEEYEKAGTAESTAKIRDFLTMSFLVEDGTQTPLSMLRAPDLAFVADGYRKRERENRLTAVFLEALAKKVGDDCVSDHYTNEQLSAMFDGLGG